LEESLSHLNFLEFTECHALSDALKAGGEQSTLDKYTQIGMEELQSWRDPWITPEKLPSITARDVKLVEDWRYSNVDKTQTEQLHQDAKKFDDDGEDLRNTPQKVFEDTLWNAEDNRSEAEEERDGEMFDDINEKDGDFDTHNRAYQPHTDGRLYNLLERRVRPQEQPLVFVEWRAPTNGPLVGHSPARFGLKTLDLTTKSNVASTNNSDTKNERHTALQETMAEPSESIESDTAEQSVEESVGYLRALIAAQTPKERNTFFATCRRMASNVKRTVEAEIETKWSWSKLARDDNWYHCRRLLQMLAHICEMRQADYEEYEMKLVMLLAAVKCGSTEAVLWLVPLEGVHLLWEDKYEEGEGTLSNSPGAFERTHGFHAWRSFEFSRPSIPLEMANRHV
jgi:hypothetical protein